MKFILLAIVSALIITGSAGLYGMARISEYANNPVADAPPETIVSIPAGSGFSGVVTALEEKRLIADRLLFKLVARINGFDRRARAGEYKVTAGMSPAEILEMIAEGRVWLRRVTIPEGFTVSQIAVLTESAGICRKADFESLLSDGDFIRELEIPADSLEGYLFPDTYLFPSKTDAGTVIKTFVNRFREVFTPAWEERAKALKMSVHEAVTLASIIEKETGHAPERQMISSVFHNRLKRGMKLQSDPTVIYGIADFDGNLTRKHLNTPGPYNTYQISGLPPGPIANPGKASLEAALYPAASRYFYFVSKGDRTHEFSRTLAAHNRAVRKYQLKK